MNSVLNKIKKINIDHIRLIAAFMIIAIHTYPLTCFGDLTDYIFTRIIFRIAVPLYLMITGYYILNLSLNNKSVLVNHIKKITKIYLISILIYGLFIIKYIKNPIYLITNLLFQGFFYHLWYFPAIILGLIITFLIIKYIPKKWQIIMVSLLYLIGVLGDNYYGFISDISVFSSFYNLTNYFTGYTRNFIFYVPIFLMLGYKISLEEKTLEKSKNISMIIKLTILMLIEGVIIYFLGSPKHTSMYIFLPTLSYFILKYLITNNTSTQDKVARELATFIYIIHPFIIIIVTKLKVINILNNSLVFYLVVSILSYILSKSIYTILKKLKRKHLTWVFF